MGTIISAPIFFRMIQLQKFLEKFFHSYFRNLPTLTLFIHNTIRVDLQILDIIHFDEHSHFKFIKRSV